ncbi:hypothetical protein [Streptantibioticus silvisoli]|uniref:Secreted protein n=1 Tax=Streptantibioticus silvisoli TaxID=2705255 RepID=A0ABT6VSS7_9ACTN|nr:hypothetical protein [Streptantibioticus silvisoli]MDI5961531.1 hypothetical protein [Streptantibioticus silvisoli]
MRRIAAVLLGSLLLSGIAVTSAHADDESDFQHFSSQLDVGSTGIEYTQDKDGGWSSNDD